MANRLILENILKVFQEFFTIIDLTNYNNEKTKIDDKDSNNNNLMTKKDIKIKNINGIDLLESLEDNSIDLVLTDPPYIISRDTGMNSHYNKVKENKENNIEFVKTEKEWLNYKKKNKLDDSKKK